MKIKVIHTVFFSPNGSTASIAKTVSRVLAERLQAEISVHDYTLPKNREQMYFDRDSVVVWASPVYAGRLPNKLLEYVKNSFQGDGVPVIPLVVYGNRNYDQSLLELTGILREKGMIPFAAGAIPARHVFSEVLGKGRPDREDLAELSAFAEGAAEQLQQALFQGRELQQIEVPGTYPPESYYVPLKEDGKPAKFLKVLPQVEEKECTGCGICTSCCPMDSISMGETGLPEIRGICIKCQACILRCPARAIHITDADFQSHKQMLEKTFYERKKASFLL